MGVCTRSKRLSCRFLRHLSTTFYALLVVVPLQQAQTLIVARFQLRLTAREAKEYLIGHVPTTNLGVGGHGDHRCWHRRGSRGWPTFHQDSTTRATPSHVLRAARPKGLSPCRVRKKSCVESICNFLLVRLRRQARVSLGEKLSIFHSFLNQNTSFLSFFLDVAGANVCSCRTATPQGVVDHSIGYRNVSLSLVVLSVNIPHFSLH